MQLIHADGLGDWREINEAGPKYQAVTAADVQRVANKYLTKENRNVAIYTRKAEKPGSDPGAPPELAGLPAEQQAAFKAMSARLKQETDAAKLKSFLGALDERAAQADEKMKPLLELQKKLIQQRLEELK